MKGMGKLVVGTLLSLAIGACALFAPKLEKPNLSVIGIDMLDGNLFEQNFRVKLKIQNPNARALPVNGLSAKLAVNGEDLARGVTGKSFVVPALGDAEFDMTVTANMAAAIFKFANKFKKDAEALDYDLSGKVSIDLPMLRSIPFHETGKFSLGNSAVK
jgi:LEA14-like dessication related protein